ncbi:MAG TPA: hypothetical protein VEA15_00095 [Caulobacteraceae bacterium]|nr:hypothetical protein [Caulobacteraceae bacterium]
MMKPITRKLPAAVVAVAVAVLAAAGVAEACSCMRYGSAAEQIAAADAVFEGRVVRTERSGRDRAATTFEVLDTVKGKLGRRVRVEHGTETAAGCGVRFRRGEIVALTAHRVRGAWTTSSCAAIQHPWADYRRARNR